LEYFKWVFWGAFLCAPWSQVCPHNGEPDGFQQALLKHRAHVSFVDQAFYVITPKRWGRPHGWQQWISVDGLTPCYECFYVWGSMKVELFYSLKNGKRCIIQRTDHKRGKRIERQWDEEGNFQLEEIYIRNRLHQGRYGNNSEGPDVVEGTGWRTLYNLDNEVWKRERFFRGELVEKMLYTPHTGDISEHHLYTEQKHYLRERGAEKDGCRTQDR